MASSRRRRAALVALLSVGCAVLTVAAPAVAAPPRDDYADARFTVPLRAAMRAFFTRRFAQAQTEFGRALRVVPDNTLAIAFYNAAALQSPDGLTPVIDREEADVVARPRDALAHVRLGFSYLFAQAQDQSREGDARAEFDRAIALDPVAPAGHVGLGVMLEDARHRTRAKLELLTALQRDPQDVLAREYLALIYQDDLKDPQQALAYVIDIPNRLPEYADIDYHIASMFDDLGQRDAAVAYATRGLEADVGRVGEAGRHGDTLLGRIYLDEHRPADARRVLKAAIAADADAVYAQTLLRKADAAGDGSVPVPPKQP